MLWAAPWAGNDVPSFPWVPLSPLPRKTLRKKAKINNLSVAIGLISWYSLNGTGQIAYFKCRNDLGGIAARTCGS